MLISKKSIFVLSFAVTFLLIYFLNNSFFKENNYIENILANNEFSVVNNVKIYNSMNEDMDNLLRKELSILDNELFNILGSVEEAKLNIIIFENLADLRKQTYLDDIGAFYDHKFNTIALALSEKLDGEFNKSIFIVYLRHEFTHYYLTGYLKKNNISAIPKWFEEGLADYVAINLKGGSAMIPTEPIIDFNLLNTRRDWKKYRKKSSQLYTQSHFAIEYLIQKNGLNVIKKIIDESSQLGFSQSFYEYTNIQLSDLHKKIDLNGNKF